MKATDDKQKKQAIRQMKFREHTRWRFRRIRNTSNLVKSGGISGVDVPVMGEDKEIKDWESITDIVVLHDVVVERNLKHLHQVLATPIGHGEGY